MADLPISGLGPITGDQVNDSVDSLPIADGSSGETKKITRGELFNSVASASFAGTVSFQDATFDSTVSFNGSTSGIQYSDIEGAPIGGDIPTDPTFNSVTVGPTIIESTGYITGAAGAEFNGYVTMLGAAEVNGNLLMRNNRITLLANPTLSSDAANKAYVDLVAGGGGGGGGYNYATRDDFVADLPSLTLTAGDVITADGVFYVYDGVASLPDLPGVTWILSVTPMHFGAVGDGTTDDRVALQAMIQWLSDNSGPVRTVDFMGREYLISGYLYMGRFDWNQDGVFDEETGPLRNVKFINGTLKASDATDWTSPWPEVNGVWDSGVPSAMIYIGEVVNQSYTTYKGENVFDIVNNVFEDLCFECSFVTGGVWIENTHRTIVNRTVHYDLGPDCWGVASPQSVGSPRGYIPINQQTIVTWNRFEGNRRTDGITGWPGKEDFNGGAEIGAAQNVTAGFLTLDGAYTTGGEFTSPTGVPYFVSIQNVYDDTLTTDYEDLRGVTFTISGFADVAKTIPVTETMQGPRGGRKIEWAYSKKRYAVITGIQADTTVTPTARSQVVLNTDYRNGGVRIGTHDGVVDFNNMTALSYAAVITGRAGSFCDNHPWSRYVVFSDNSRKFTIIGNYLDYTTTEVGGQGHQIIGNSHKVGSPAIILIANEPNDVGEGLIVKDNSLFEEAVIAFEDNGANTWETDVSLVKYEYSGREVYTENISKVYPGYATFGKGGEFHGYFSVFGGGEFNGNLLMRNNRIALLADPVNPTDAATKSYVDSAVAGGGSSTPTFDSISVGTTGVTTISTTGYITGAAGASFAGYVDFLGNMSLNGNRILAAQSVTLPLQSTEPAGSDGTVAMASAAATVTNGFGAAGVGMYTKRSGSWEAATPSQEKSDVLTGTTPSVDHKAASVFEITSSGNTTFSFVSPPTGHAYGFTLVITAGGTHTFSYPASVKWPGGTQPTDPASGQTQILGFFTLDGGTTWYGFLGGDDMS